MTMASGLEGRKSSNGKFVLGTSTTGLFSFVLPLLRVYGTPYAVPYSFTPSLREVFLGVKGRITRVTHLTGLNTSTGTNFLGVRIAGVDFDTLLPIPPLGVGAFDSGDLTSLDITIEETDLFAMVADRSGILVAGELWQPFAVYATIEVIG